jgi:hypothetical protein
MNGLSIHFHLILSLMMRYKPVPGVILRMAYELKLTRKDSGRFVPSK